MIRIRQLFDTTTREDRNAFAAVLRIYRKVFDYDPEYTDKIAGYFSANTSCTFEPILLIAEGVKNRVLGFSLIFFFPELNCAYLDHIASSPNRRMRGYGNALYEATQKLLEEKGCEDLFLDVPPDDATKLKESARLAINKKRLAFYEQYDARPILNTRYDEVSHKGNAGYLTYLVYDRLKAHKPLGAQRLRQVVKRILQVKARMNDDDPKLQEILDSITDDPVQLRAPRYTTPLPARMPQGITLDVVSSGDAHQIHHLREKGYVEKPARVTAILKGLEGVKHKKHPLRRFSEKPIHEVHDAKLIRFIKQAGEQLKPGQLLYPNIFPIRHPEKLPKNWDMRAGYFCMDTFTPLTNNVYKAARNAVDAALTGAHLVHKGSPLCYVICRPPGHHAEFKTFGGFCYFNNAAIAAHYLSASGPVAVLDIDYHHGNGTQDIFYQRSDVLTLSIHGHPSQAYPYFSGFVEETGEGNGRGFNHNIPIYPGANDEDYLVKLDKAIRYIKRFKPKYLVISLGLDIMSGDPTGTFLVSKTGINRIGQRLGSLNIPTLVVQEGGYSLSNIRHGIAVFFSGMIQTRSSYTQSI